MTPDKIEKIFWLALLAWFILRGILLGCQYIGNTDPGVAEELLKYFTQADIDAGRNYALNGFWFKAIYGTFFVLALVCFVKFGLVSMLWQKLSEICGSGFFRADLLFVIVFLLIVQLLSFPSDLYFGHFRETGEGFATVGIGGWLIKYLKSVLIGMAFETAGIMLLLAVLRWFPVRWPVILPLVMGGFGLLITLVAPMIITPLFYEQKPLEAGDFRDRLLAMAARAGMAVKEIYVIDESRYSKHTNAYFTGVGSFRRIVLYDNLVKSHTPDEAALIFAHEAGHWRYNHVAWGLTLGTAGLLISGLLYQYLFPLLTQVPWFGLGEISAARNLPFIMIAITLLQLFTAPFESQVSQFMERQADQVALELTGLNDVYKDAQIRLARDNRSDLLPHPLRVFWLYSHPPALDRIRAADLK